MRELVFKNLTSENKKRKDLYITETIDRNGVKTVTRRHSIYIVGGHSKVKGANGAVQHKKAIPGNDAKRHVFIFKKRDTKQKKDSFVCDVVGKFYAVVKDELYSVAFKHSFEIDFLFTTHKQGGDTLA
ncbi:MAG: hypothetical protein HQ566_02185 [Candidatus Omnitrophica bacterium]|nr:hypothetical protein [Candidatus Omnitrophota bacterium]